MTTDQGFREIQLNGKQLVFLFMAVTVISVVIFLFGVLVGRGVRADRPAPAESASAEVVPDSSAARPAETATAAVQPPAEPPAPADELTYFDRLQKNDTPRETLKSSSPAPNMAKPSAPVKAPSPAPPAPQPSAAGAHPAASSGAEPPGPGFAVQVTIAKDRPSADTLVTHLMKEGYPAYVVGPVTSGGKVIYRIRVGKYKTLKEADAVKARLETEQFKPWVVR